MNREFQDDMRPWDEDNPVLEVVQTYDFKRPRADILGAGKLYVALMILLLLFLQKQSLAKSASPAERWARDDYVDKEYIEYCCARMARTREWDDISKIRLVRGDYNSCTFEFVRQGADGQDEILTAPELGWNSWHKKHHAHKFTEELQLTHAVVNGADEYSI